MVILDTNVISEVVKGAPSDHVARWFAAQEPTTVFTTSVTQAELLFGVRMMPAGRRRAALDEAITRILQRFDNRILAFDEEAAPVFAEIAASRRRAGQPIGQFDGQIAAIARARGAALATRDVRDFADCGIDLIDPWA
jgi:hypothetical protein